MSEREELCPRQVEAEELCPPKGGGVVPPKVEAVQVSVPTKVQAVCVSRRLVPAKGGSRKANRVCV